MLISRSGSSMVWPFLTIKNDHPFPMGLLGLIYHPFPIRIERHTVNLQVQRTPLAIKQGVGGATFQGNPVVFIPLHRGADGFMSDQQFRKFYWPTLKALIVGLANEGCVPFLFCEGSYNSRLGYLKELPKGSCMWVFDRTDMARVNPNCFISSGLSGA
jgi:hypothetical protein